MYVDRPIKSHDVYPQEMHTITQPWQSDHALRKQWAQDHCASYQGTTMHYVKDPNRRLTLVPVYDHHFKDSKDALLFSLKWQA